MTGKTKLKAARGALFILAMPVLTAPASGSAMAELRALQSRPPLAAGAAIDGALNRPESTVVSIGGGQAPAGPELSPVAPKPEEPSAGPTPPSPETSGKKSPGRALEFLKFSGLMFVVALLAGGLASIGAGAPAGLVLGGCAAFGLASGALAMALGLDKKKPGS